MDGDLMEIEVITTKKRLTKSVVKQLNTATEDDFNHLVNVTKKGFYIIGLGKGYSYKTALFYGLNRWCTLSIRDWRSVIDRPELNASTGGKWTTVKSFSSIPNRDSWFYAYNDVVKLCLKNHLII